MAKKILFINQEIVPYVPETDLSHMGKALPQVMQESGHEIRTFMPKWGNINERRGQLHEVIRLSGMNLIIDDTDHPLIIKVASIVQTRIQVYFIDNDDYFTRRQMDKDENGMDYADNGERAIFFARGVLETVKKLRWVPDIIHVQGWMGAVVPLFIKDFVVRQFYTKVQDRNSSAGLTNMGALKVSDTMKPYIERFDIYMGQPFSSRTNCAIISFEDVLTINFASSIIEADVERYFFRKLVQDGIHVKIESNRDVEVW